MTHRKEVLAVLIVVGAGALILVYVAARAIGQVVALGNDSSGNHAVDTSSWQTYQNTTFGFSIQYPPNWKIYTGGLSASTPFIVLGNPLS